MNLRKTQSGRATSMARGLTIGTAVSLTVTLVSAILLVKLIDQEILVWEKVGYGIIAVLLTASFAGAWTSYQKIRHQRLMVCMLTGAIYWAVLICIAALCYSGEFEGFFVSTGVIFAGCASAFLMNTPRNHRRAGKKYRSAHR